MTVRIHTWKLAGNSSVVREQFLGAGPRLDRVKMPSRSDIRMLHAGKEFKT